MRETGFRHQLLSELGRVQRLNPDLDVVKLFKSSTGEQVGLNRVEAEMLKRARDSAEFKVKQVFYDLAESSRAADAARFIAPFANAWQEEITRWAALTWSRPHIPAVMMNMWEEKDSLPFTYKDPRTGDDIFYLPFGDQIVKFATGSWNPVTGAPPETSWGLAVPWKNLNIVTGNGFLPGGGPWLQASARFFRQRNIPGISDLAQAIDPYNRDLIDTLLPSPFIREFKRAGQDEHTRSFANTWNTVLAEQLFKAGGDISKVSVEETEQAARGLAIIGSVSNLLLGGGVRPQLAPGMREVADYASWLSQVAPKAKERLLFERYGDKIVGFIQSRTRVLTGQPPTADAEDMFVTPGNRQMFDEFGEVAWTMMSENVRGDFDPFVYALQIQRGDRELIVGDEFYTAATNIVAWSRYSEVVEARDEALHAAGIVSTRVKEAEPIMEQFRQYVEGIKSAYPGFARELEAKQSERQFDRRKNMELLKRFVHLPQAQGLKAAEGANEYLTARNALLAAMQREGFRGLDSVQALELARQWSLVRSQILNRFPEFRLVHAKLGFTFDDVLDVDELEEVA